MEQFDRVLLRGFACATVIVLAALAWPSEGWSQMTKPACDIRAIVTEQLTNWTKKLAESSSQNPEPVVGTYEPRDAVLLPTCATGFRVGREQITLYFEKFLEDQPRGKIDPQAAKIGGDCEFPFASGNYLFTLNGGTGPEVRARYTFIFQRTDSGYLIAQHHSSLQPLVPEAKCPVH